MARKGVIELYKIQCKEFESEGETRTLYGVADENGFLLDFTDDIFAAQRIVDLLNINQVEQCHVFDVVEDLLYSGSNT